MGAAVRILASIDDAQIARLIEHSRLQDALIRALSDRIAKLEPHEHVDRTGWMTAQIAAHRSGFSESGIRKMVREKRVEHQWEGGRLFITEVPTRRR